MRMKSRLSSIIYLLLWFFIVTSCTNTTTTKHKPRIGLLMETLKEERWQHDRDFFVAKAKELGADVEVSACNGDDNLQIAQAENMLAKGVDILVVVPHNG